MSVCPIKRNVCIDANPDEPQGYVIPNFCQSSSTNSAGLWILSLLDITGSSLISLTSAAITTGTASGIASSTDTVGQFCTGKGFGGLDSTTPGDYYLFPEFSSKGTKGPVDSCKASNITRGNYCTAVSPAIIQGETGACTKQANFGDPLLCCLRDYQCNGAGDIFGDGCFTSDYNSPGGAQQSCGPDFRATDTQPCQFLTTQYCLGNYSTGKGNDVTTLPDGEDFTALWVNSGFDGQNYVVNSLPTGTRYQTKKDISISGACKSLNPSDGTPNFGENCTASGQVQPLHDTNQYQSTEQPICQQIFWRTLYGNQPEFRNQFWRPEGSRANCPAGQTICEDTSVPPSAAACAALPFGGDPTPTGVTWARSMFNAMYKKLKAKGTQLTQPVNVGADKPLLEWMYTVCSKYPQICQDILKEECAGTNPEEFNFNLNKWNWCGCYMSDDKYQKYTDNFGISKECTPYCNAQNVIPALNGTTTTPARCTQNVCLIDNVAINLAKTHFQNSTNNINFSQICGGCGSGYTGSIVNQNGIQNTTGNSLVNNIVSQNCQCVMSNFTLNTLGTNITNGGINLSQSCNGNAKCYNTVTNADGTETANEISCGNTGTNINTSVENLKKELQLKAENTANYWAIFLGFILICVIVIIWILFSPSGTPEKDIKFSKYTKAPKNADISYLNRELYSSKQTIDSLQGNIKSLNQQIIDLTPQPDYSVPTFT